MSVLKKRSGAHEDSLREYRLTSNGIWLGEPLTQFHGVLAGTPQLLREPATAL
jgi:circadian clock protein KaiC